MDSLITTGTIHGGKVNNASQSDSIDDYEFPHVLDNFLSGKGPFNYALSFSIVAIVTAARTL
jgi:hypothetical protein